MQFVCNECSVGRYYLDSNWMDAAGMHTWHNARICSGIGFHYQGYFDVIKDNIGLLAVTILGTSV